MTALVDNTALNGAVEVEAKADGLWAIEFALWTFGKITPDARNGFIRSRTNAYEALYWQNVADGLEERGAH